MKEACIHGAEVLRRSQTSECFHNLCCGKKKKMKFINCPVIIFAENPIEIKKKTQNFIFAGNPIKNENWENEKKVGFSSVFLIFFENAPYFSNRFFIWGGGG